jgi:hypothetical protein
MAHMSAQIGVTEVVWPGGFTTGSERVYFLFVGVQIHSLCCDAKRKSTAAIWVRAVMAVIRVRV